MIVIVILIVLENCKSEVYYHWIQYIFLPKHKVL